MNSFRAFRIHQNDNKIVSRVETIALEDLAPGEVVIKVAYSGINYKDALAATGTGRILRKYPLVGGIDLSGEVVESRDPQFKAGQKVLVTGCGLSETHDGGYAEFARMRGEWVIPMPAGLDSRSAMLLGTAGFTAALAIHRMEQNGLLPDQGEILVNGATGGVGSIAINMLAGRGYDVVALTGKTDAASYLKQLGAKRVVSRADLQLGNKPLEAMLWAGAIDNLGGDILGWLTRTTKDWGSIASVGMASSMELKTTVLPFILRSVNLLGINSVNVPRAPRLQVWQRIATDLKPRHLDVIGTRTIELDELPNAFDAYIKGGVTGRTVVKIGWRRGLRSKRTMTTIQLEAAAADLGVNLSEEQAAKLIRLLGELDDWNSRMNLTAIRERPQQITKHLLDSLSVHRFLRGERIADIGTGAGFPGLPLAAVNLEKQFTLVDSVAKKLKFVEHAAQVMGLQNVRTLHARAEAIDLKKMNAPRFDCVIARAVGQLGMLVQVAGHLLVGGGRLLAMKGKRPEAELGSLPSGWKVAEIHRLTVPGLDEERHLVELWRSHDKTQGPGA